MKKKNTRVFLFALIYGTVVLTIGWVVPNLTNFTRIGFFVIGGFFMYVSFTEIMRNVSNKS